MFPLVCVLSRRQSKSGQCLGCIPAGRPAALTKQQRIGAGGSPKDNCGHAPTTRERPSGRALARLRKSGPNGPMINFSPKLPAGRPASQPIDRNKGERVSAINGRRVVAISCLRARAVKTKQSQWPARRSSKLGRKWGKSCPKGALGEPSLGWKSSGASAGRVSFGRRRDAATARGERKREHTIELLCKLAPLARRPPDWPRSSVAALAQQSALLMWPPRRSSRLGAKVRKLRNGAANLTSRARNSLGRKLTATACSGRAQQVVAACN